MVKAFRNIAWALALLSLILAPILAPLVPAQAANITLDGDLIIPNVCTITGATPQTCNARSGAVTTGTLTTAAVTNAAYVINNSAVVATSRVYCQILAYSGTPVTNGIPVIVACAPAAGTITLQITNAHASNAMNGTLVLAFWVLN